MHDDGDWDSDIGSDLIDIAPYLGGWPGFFCALAGVCFLLYHFFG